MWLAKAETRVVQLQTKKHQGFMAISRLDRGKEGFSSDDASEGA